MAKAFIKKIIETTEYKNQNMVTVKVYIVREKDGTYSSYLDENANLPYGLVGEGNSVTEAINEWQQAYNDMRKLFEEEGKEFEEANFTFVYDVPSFLSYYGELISFKGLSKLTGISSAQLSQYATGYRYPSAKTTAKIQKGIHRIATELSQVVLV